MRPLLHLRLVVELRQVAETEIPDLESPKSASDAVAELMRAYGEVLLLDFVSAAY